MQENVTIYLTYFEDKISFKVILNYAKTQYLRNLRFRPYM